MKIICVAAAKKNLQVGNFVVVVENVRRARGKWRNLVKILRVLGSQVYTTALDLTSLPFNVFAPAGTSTKNVNFYL